MNANKILVSVIIPIYNAASYLAKCLDSVLSQTLTNIEIICIDDASTDACSKILAEYVAENKNITIITNKQNSGSSFSRNIGMKYANGEFIFFLDADDFLADNISLEILYNAAMEDGSDEVLGRIVRWFPKTGEETEGYHAPYQIKEKRGVILIDYPLVARNVIVCNKLLRREFLEQHNITFDPTLQKFEDNPFACKVHIYAKCISYIPHTTYIHRQITYGDTSKMHTVKPEDAVFKLASYYDVLGTLEICQEKKVRSLFEYNAKSLVKPTLYFFQNHVVDRAHAYTFIRILRLVILRMHSLEFCFPYVFQLIYPLLAEKKYEGVWCVLKEKLNTEIAPAILSTLSTEQRIRMELYRLLPDAEPRFKCAADFFTVSWWDGCMEELVLVYEALKDEQSRTLFLNLVVSIETENTTTSEVNASLEVENEEMKENLLFLKNELKTAHYNVFSLVQSNAPFNAEQSLQHAKRQAQQSQVKNDTTQKNIVSTEPQCTPENHCNRFLRYPDNTGKRVAEGGMRMYGQFKKSLPGKPLVTVVTTVRNCVEHVRQAMCSVMSQTYENIEYIVIDALSTDGTLDIIKQLKSRIDYYISEPDSGVYAGMNKGISLASGEYVMLLNGDDYYRPDAVESLVNEVLRTKADIVAGNLEYLSPTKKQIWKACHDVRIFIQCTCFHGAMLVARNCYNRNGLYREDYKIISDWVWMVEANKREKFNILDKLISTFRAGGLSGVELETHDAEKFDFLSRKIPYLTLEDCVTIRYLYHADKKTVQNLIEKYADCDPFVKALRWYLTKTVSSVQPEIVSGSEQNKQIAASPSQEKSILVSNPTVPFHAREKTLWERMLRPLHIWQRYRFLKHSRLFFADFYILNNPDVAEAKVDPLRHFIEHGSAEGRDPNPLFSLSWYISQNPDVAAEKVCPLYHYVKFGWHEGRSPSPQFSIEEYFCKRQDVLAENIEPLSHYLLKGIFEE